MAPLSLRLVPLAFLARLRMLLRMRLRWPPEQGVLALSLLVVPLALGLWRRTQARSRRHRDGRQGCLEEYEARRRSRAALALSEMMARETEVKSDPGCTGQRLRPVHDVSLRCLALLRALTEAEAAGVHPDLLRSGRLCAFRVLLEELPALVEKTNSGRAPFADGQALQQVILAYDTNLSDARGPFAFFRKSSSVKEHESISSARTTLRALSGSHWRKMKRLVATAEPSVLVAAACKAACGVLFGSLNALQYRYLAGVFDSVQAVDASLGLKPLPPGSFRRNLLSLLLTKTLCCFVRLMEEWCTVRGSRQFILSLRQILFGRLLEQDCAYFDVHRPHEVNLLLQEAGDLDAKLIDMPASILTCLSRILSVYWTIYSQGGALLCLTLAVGAPISSWMSSLVLLWAEGRQRCLKLMDSERSGCFFSVFGSHFQTVRNNGAELREEEEYRFFLCRQQRYDERVRVVSALISPVVELICEAGKLLGIVHASALVSRQILSHASLISVVSMADVARIDMISLPQMLADLRSVARPAANIMDVLDAAPSIGLRSSGIVPVDAECVTAVKLEFCNVSFAYPSRPEVIVLQDISIVANPYEVVALCGSSGSGKSTILALINRLYDPSNTRGALGEAGNILIDGHDLRSLQPLWLRQQMAVVSQEPVLFPRSVRDNITYGCSEDVSNEEIHAAARAAHCHDFIEALPDGYYTHVDSAQLSGGQKQRVAIARALLQRPRLLLLDEATSALDEETAALVQDALETLMANCTTIVIAHRLSTIQRADRVYHLEAGRVVSSGPPPRRYKESGALVSPSALAPHLENSAASTRLADADYVRQLEMENVELRRRLLQYERAPSNVESHS